MKNFYITCAIMLSALLVQADVELPKVLRSFPMILSGKQISFISNNNDGARLLALNNIRTNQSANFPVSQILMENNLCSVCLCLGTEPEWEYTIEYRLNQIKMNEGDKNALFFTEISFLLNDNDEGILQCSNIRMLNTSEKYLNNLKEEFNVTNSNMIEKESKKNFGFLTNLDSTIKLIRSVKKEVPPVQVAVSLPQFNILYRGAKIKIQLAAFNVPPESIHLTATNSIISGEKGNFTIVAGEGPTCEVIAYQLNNFDTVKISKTIYRVARLPTPLSEVGGKSGTCTMSKNVLAVQQGVFAKLLGFPIEVEYKTVSFHCKVISNGKETSYSSNSIRITKEMSLAFNDLESGDVVIFSDIIASGPGNEMFELNDIKITIE